MKIEFSIFLVIIIAFIIYFYFKENRELTIKKAKDLISQNYFDHIVDVRTLEEWNEGHHQLAIHIPIGILVTELPKKIPDKNSKILFYCKKGFRASGAYQIAKKLGYKNIYYLDDRGIPCEETDCISFY